MLLLYIIPVKLPKQKFTFFLEVLLTNKIRQNPAVGVFSYLSTSKVRTAAIFVLLVIGN
jgi:hypothetical protein